MWPAVCPTIVRVALCPIVLPIHSGLPDAALPVTRPLVPNYWVGVSHGSLHHAAARLLMFAQVSALTGQPTSHTSMSSTFLAAADSRRPDFAPAVALPSAPLPPAPPPKHNHADFHFKVSFGYS